MELIALLTGNPLLAFGLLTAVGVALTAFFAAPQGPGGGQNLPQPRPGQAPTPPTGRPTGAPQAPGARPQPRPAGPGGPQNPNAQMPGEEEEEEESHSDVAAVAGEMAPWLISLAVHAAIVVLAMFIVWAAVQKKVKKKEPIIPIAKFSKQPGAPLSMQTTTRISSTSSSRRTVTKSETKTVNLTSKVKADNSLIGVAGGTSGKANPFGAGVGSGGPFNAGFFGSGGNAKNIAYLVDASGSLIDTFPFVIAELKRSINELSEAQAFAVVFFQGDKAYSPWQGLRKASAANKKAAMLWIDPSSDKIRPAGADTNPIPALKQALRYKPQLLFLLSDNITGRQKYEINQKTLVTEVRKANVAGTKINTIQFLYPDPLEQYGFKGTLELIARESGGLFKFVDARELGIEN